MLSSHRCAMSRMIMQRLFCKGYSPAVLQGLLCWLEFVIPVPSRISEGPTNVCFDTAKAQSFHCFRPDQRDIAELRAVVSLQSHSSTLSEIPAFATTMRSSSPPTRPTRSITTAAVFSVSDPPPACNQQRFLLASQ